MTMIPDTAPSASLAQEFECGSALLKLLQQEQELLISADAEGLNAAVEEKSRLVARLAELTGQRHMALAACGLEASEAGMQAWYDAGASDARDTWERLLELAHGAKELNRINGMLIGQHLSRTQTALNVLRGAPAGSSMYGPDGQTTAPASGRKFVVG